MKEKLEQLKKEVLEKLKVIKDIQVLRDLEIQYLGRKGELTLVLRQLSDLSLEQKKNIGSAANDLKLELAEKFKHAAELLESEKKNDFVDLTLPGEKINRGRLHPLTIVQNELEDIFTSLGFMILDGPELESDYFNFEALNIPSYHPARDMQDTFYVTRTNTDLTRTNADKTASDLVLRTHTSPVQVRAMQKYGAPFRGVVPGRVFRSENTDAGHDHTFYQMEGLMVDKDISLSNLISVMKELLNGIFKRGVETRIRPGYFPFVEPGIELDMQCVICRGAGCSTCKHSGWLELMPAGMVHPNVLRAGGINPKEYSGFAFGLGLTRLVMMKYGIADIRLLQSGDLRFLEQF